MQDTFEKLLAESTNTYFQAYFDHDFGEINRLLQEQRSLRKTLTNELRNYADQSIVLYTKLVQTYNIFNKLIQNEEQKRILQKIYYWSKSDMKRREKFWFICIDMHMSSIKN